MAIPKFVKKARKDNPAVSKGESYWWWKFRRSGKYYSKEKPKPSQLTQSHYYSTVYSIQETLPDNIDQDHIQNMIDQIQELGEGCQESFDNMPESLQYGETGQLLEERVAACEQCAQELENIDFEEMGVDCGEEISEAVSCALGDLEMM